ncbi:O-methyltransferase [Winogradskyella flava]|uniref:O-methyltransferase n=1 Tax=Winogradskyella flava TaxID=1884876 RepID=A0A842ITT4_9FLAO|nr:O-methyltransferase [Winogradskyella flava]MBC2845186.1 O-methyltransferase [Winogradskyella flava]
MKETIFEKVDHYLSEIFSLEDDILKDTESSIVENGMPEHSVSSNQGQFLYLLAKMCNAKNIIEIGTLGGYSSIWLGRAINGQGKVISIEIDKDFAEVAKRNIEKAGLTNTVEVKTGRALDVLNQIDLKGKSVDLFFMDADKPNYVAYFDWALKNARKGSLIIADNVIREGKVLDQNSTDEKVVGVRAYNQMLAKNNKVVSSVLQQVGIKDYDGIAISLVK